MTRVDKEGTPCIVQKIDIDKQPYYYSRGTIKVSMFDGSECFSHTSLFNEILHLPEFDGAWSDSWRVQDYLYNAIEEWAVRIYEQGKTIMPQERR